MNDSIYNKLNELAEQAGCSKIKESYNEVRTSMLNKTIKQYAVLGDVNVGKSTIINILAGEKKLPVSVRSNEHGQVAFVESEKNNCRWVELSTSSYVNDDLAAQDSPLWHIDAAVYVLSAVTPFSQQDVDAVKSCIAHGVPCSLVLSKLDTVEESEKAEIVAYIRSQSEHYFGTDSLILINVKDEEATRQAVIKEFASAEDSTDIRDYALAVSYANALKEQITANYNSAKEKMQLVSKKEAQAKISLDAEKIAWDSIKLGIESRKLKLIDEMSVEMNRLYANCIASLTDKAMLAKSPKDWWKQSLEAEFSREIVKISNSIDRLICSSVAADRDWLVHTVEQKFGSKLSADAEGSSARLDTVVFGVAPESLSCTRLTKTVAIAGMTVSSVALCCVLAYPVLAMHSINALYWKVAGIAVAGTGYWTFLETKKEKADRQQCLREELAKYILRSRDENIEVLKNNIEYGYKNMCISAQDMQLASSKEPLNSDDKKVYDEFRAISEISRRCDEIVGSMLSEE